MLFVKQTAVHQTTIDEPTILKRFLRRSNCAMACDTKEKKRRCKAL